MPSAVDRQWAAGEGVMVIDAGVAGIRAWWLPGAGPEGPDKPVSALSLVVHGQAPVGDTVKSCPDGVSLPLQ